ncbi:group III truncated hemoglobin [Brumimicrobium aurantiacum]|uniref:Group III truncated hemoglobin n=1 Tax=Brumimicrobium aurantiacum TaxID=1737063 RepID=A0A3E1EZ00_9FLAO|nr:group III truncated hemoglobin [Brumimicrobium aurantiacum]RFC54687.1 group III truncated hemoglobin [Brumimicrobium aurantiacum]
MKDIQNRADLRQLVHAFYDKIREDDMLGPIFNGHIKEDQWPSHLEKLTDFWETNLFGVPKFKGSPPQAHVEVDHNMNYGITQEHFARWIQLWFDTIKTLFEGKVADRAMNAARKMSTGLFLAIWSRRPENRQ